MQQYVGSGELSVIIVTKRDTWPEYAEAKQKHSNQQDQKAIRRICTS